MKAEQFNVEMLRQTRADNDRLRLCQVSAFRRRGAAYGRYSFVNAPRFMVASGVRPYKGGRKQDRPAFSDRQSLRVR